MNGVERALVALGRELDVPPVPDLAAAVVGDLAPRRRPLVARRLALVLVAALAAALIATLAIPDARSALARILHIGGERIELVDELPRVAPGYAGLELTLGREVSLAEARRRAGFSLLELGAAPDRVYLGARGTVWFLYGAPDAVRLLVAQTPNVTPDKPFLEKLASAGTNVERLVVRGRPAFFLSGEPHVVLLVDERGEPVEETVRLARDVLVWEADGRTVRLEGMLNSEEASAIAESLRVRSPG